MLNNGIAIAHIKFSWQTDEWTVDTVNSAKINPYVTPFLRKNDIKIENVFKRKML